MRVVVFAQIGNIAMVIIIIIIDHLVSDSGGDRENNHHKCDRCVARDRGVAVNCHEDFTDGDH